MREDEVQHRKIRVLGLSVSMRLWKSQGVDEGIRFIDRTGVRRGKRDQTRVWQSWKWVKNGFGGQEQHRYI
jgi:hypothetical protein